MPNSFKNTIESPDTACPECGWHSWNFAKCKNQGGTYQYFFMCTGCGYRQKKYIPYKVIQAAGVEPDEVQPIEPRHKCEVCGADGAQNHHWAPYALFGP